MLTSQNLVVFYGDRIFGSDYLEFEQTNSVALSPQVNYTVH
jgi:hypothetical protein